MIHHGDLFDVLPTLAADSIDACVTDPPYGIGFMGREWDTFSPTKARDSKHFAIGHGDKGRKDSINPNLRGRRQSPALSPSQIEYDRSLEGQRGFQDWTAAWAAEVYRVLKPGAYIVVCGAPRAHHRMMSGLEDAGFEIVDCFAWLCSQGFPKNFDVAFNIHKQAEQAAEHDVRFVLSTHLSEAVYACRECGQVLLHRLSEQKAQARWRAASSSGTARSAEPCVERWSDAEAAKGELQRCPVCSMSHGFLADGSEGRLHRGAQARDGADARQAPDADGSRASHRPQPVQQPDGEPDAVRLERRAQASRGVGTALKPAHEPIALARKPFKGSITACYLANGTAALNIDACRLETDDSLRGGGAAPLKFSGQNQRPGHENHQAKPTVGSDLGRWPANVLLDEEAAQLLDEQSGELVSGANPTRRGSEKFRNTYGEFKGQDDCVAARGLDVGGASRFFYCAKPSREERNQGCYDLPKKMLRWSSGEENPGSFQSEGTDKYAHNFHPTVKPVALMRWLVRLVTPPGGTVLDPFTGSGTTGMACRLELREFIGCEREADYVEIATRRIAACAPLFAAEGTHG